MRLLHTADWHVGKTLHRQSRYDEMRDVLAEIGDIADDRDVDAVLLAGDVYDHKSPSAEAEEVVYDALLRLVRSGKQVVIIPGNHDNPGKWKAIRPLLDRFEIHVVPRVLRPDDGGIIELTTGDERLQVAALPWVGKRRFVGAQELMAPDRDPYSEYNDGLGRLMAGLTVPLDPDACNVLMGHMHVDGARLGGGERSLTIGQLYAVAPQQIPQVQYAAFGHVHRPQDVKNAPVPARYAGSPLKFDFGETGYDNSVTLVDLAPSEPAAVETVELTRGRELLNVRGTIDELEARADEIADAFLKVTVECEGPEHDMSERVREFLPHALDIRLNYPTDDVEEEGESLRDLSAREQFARYYHEEHGTEPDEGDLDLFEELLHEAETGEAL